MNIDIEGLHPVANTDRTDRRADVIFIHGLAGASHATWRHGCEGDEDHFFWPAELGSDLPACGIWTVGYPAGITEFGQPGMIIEKRAGNLAHKLVNAGLGDRPLILVTHSMGGLIVKSLLVDSDALPDAERKRLAGQVRGIVFCGTPHRGSFFANAAGVLAKFAGGTQAHVDQMRQNAEPLDFLHDRFVEWHRRNPVPVESYAENQKLLQKKAFGRAVQLGPVVPRASANPGITGHIVKDVDENHFSLVKPRARTSDVYAGVLRFIRKALEDAPDAEAGGPLQRLLSTELAAEAATSGLIVRAHVLRVLMRQPSLQPLMTAYGVDCSALASQLSAQIGRMPSAAANGAPRATESVAGIVARARELAAEQPDAGLALWAALAEHSRQILGQTEAILSTSNREWRALLLGAPGLGAAVRGETPYRS